MLEIVVTIVLFVINVVLGVAMWALKQTFSQIKDQATEHSRAINHIKEHYFKKEDFREFKEELWSRFDKLERKVEERVNK